MKSSECKAYVYLLIAILLLVFGVLTCQAAAKADEKKTPIAVEVLLIISAVMFMSSCLATCLTVITGCSEKKEHATSTCTSRSVLLYLGYSIFLCIVYAGLQDGSIKSGWYDKPVERVFITFIILSFIGLCLCCTPSVNAGTSTNTSLYEVQEVVIETAMSKEASQKASQTASTTSQLQIVTSPIQDGSKTTTI